jgi:hypothetical protein
MKNAGASSISLVVPIPCLEYKGVYALVMHRVIMAARLVVLGVAAQFPSHIDVEDEAGELFCGFEGQPLGE